MWPFKKKQPEPQITPKPDPECINYVSNADEDDIVLGRNLKPGMRCLQEKTEYVDMFVGTLRGGGWFTYLKPLYTYEDSNGKPRVGFCAIRDDNEIVSLYAGEVETFIVKKSSIKPPQCLTIKDKVERIMDCLASDD